MSEHTEGLIKQTLGDTPRTDALDKGHGYLMMRFARQLERELADKTDWLTTYKESVAIASAELSKKDLLIENLKAELDQANQEALQVYSTYSISEVMRQPESINKIWNRGERISRHKKGNEK